MPTLWGPVLFGVLALRPAARTVSAMSKNISMSGSITAHSRESAIALSSALGNVTLEAGRRTVLDKRQLRSKSQVDLVLRLLQPGREVSADIVVDDPSVSTSEVMHIVTTPKSMKASWEKR